MPIKMPKGFQRRKSSGNVLDEPQPTSTDTSFKVFARPQTGPARSDLNTVQQKSLPGGRNSYEQEDDDLFTVLRPDAANRGTTTSLSTAPYDSAASSTRLSSSSTNPSSVDTRSDRNVQSVVATSHGEPPIPPAHKSNGFLRNAGRTFSFGVKTKPLETAEPPVPPVPSTKGRFSFTSNRDRAMTASSVMTSNTVSTATPPRLLESDLSLDNSGLDGFGNMFDSIGAKSRDQSPIRNVPSENYQSAYRHELRTDGPQPIRPAPLESPYSYNSDTSRDGLMHTPSSINTVVHNSPQLTSGKTFGKTLSSVGTSQQADQGADENMFSETPSRPRASSRPTRQNAPPPSAYPTSNRYNSSHSSSSIPGNSIQTSPILESEDPVVDPSILASAALATRYQESKSSRPSAANNKVMTPAQFERYKQQQDERHRMNKVFKNKQPESDDSDDNYEDVEEDDDAERLKQAAQQRRKQEAHLAVYRQTMMKVTGEGPSQIPASNASVVNQNSATRSTTDLSNQFSNIRFDKSPARSTDEDEDDDVPLGILAAHGFPNKNRPPNRLASSLSNPNLRGVIPPQAQQPPPSVAGESMKRGSLPVFARHLPEDPYYGASLVNQSHRESMAFNTQSNYNPSGASTAHPHHPAGLVGVIAGEEKARAMRRGSPSGGYEQPPMGHPGMARAQTTGSMPNLLMPPGMPGMPGMMGMPQMMPGMLSAGDQAQIQMSQQMTQMMQVQMQWMQQMQQMMANQGPNGSIPQINQPMPNMPPTTRTGAALPRPQSVPLQEHFSQSEQRTMSMLNPPTITGWNNGIPSFRSSVYAPSVAPSERSNVGLASRYRPVSTMVDTEPQQYNKRASTMTSTTFRPWSQFGSSSKQPTSTVRKVAANADDEDDEQGWAEMKAKKDQKKKTWKIRKQNVLQELYNG